MPKILTPNDKEYIKKLKQKLDQEYWSVNRNGNEYTVSCKHNVIVSKDDPLWREMKKKFLEALVSDEDIYQFNFPLDGDTFDNIYQHNVSPWLVARTVHLIDNYTDVLKFVLSKSANKFNVKIVCEVLKQKFSYKLSDVAARAPNSHDFYTPYQKICTALSHLCIQNNESINHEMSLAFIENIQKSDIKVNDNVEEMYLISLFEKSFQGINFDIFCKALNINTQEDIIEKNSDIQFATFNINNKMALLHHFDYNSVGTIIKYMKTKKDLPKVFVLESNQNITTLAIEQKSTYSKDMIASLFNDLIKKSYNVYNDVQKEYELLDSIINKYQLEFCLNEAIVNKHYKLKI
jgi:hypothetical protein